MKFDLERILTSRVFLTGMHVHPLEEVMFTEMVIITRPFTCGYLRNKHNNVYSKNALFARIHCPDCEIFLVHVICDGDTSLIIASHSKEFGEAVLQKSQEKLKI